MGKYLDLFTRYLADEKKMSENTIQSYRRDLSRLESYCSDLAIDDLSEVTEHNLETYIDYLEAGEFKSSTISRNVASIHAFYSYLYTLHEVDEDVSRGLAGPKVERVNPDILTEDEVVRLLDAPLGNDPKGLRDKAMLEVMYATGIKVSELIKLKLSDLDLKTDMLSVNGRNIPLGRHARNAMMAYLENARMALIADRDSQVMFPNYQGEEMSRQGFWKILKSYVKDAGIEKDVTPCLLRHSFAAHLIEHGADIKSVSVMLGHSDISTTQVYARMAQNSLRKTYAGAHPRN
ncbi:MAG: tyrosine recombinase [Lachnospiraceae bacterium]|nr:tyrosine recombinase [Lachnospiraceae bacterium]